MSDSREPRAAAWTDSGAETIGEAVIAGVTAGGVDHLFFVSGSEIAFLQEGIARAHAEGRPAPRLISVPHEHPALCAALGYAAVSGRPVMTAVHVDAGTLHHGGALSTAAHAGLPVVLTAGAPPVAFTGSLPGSRDDGGHLWAQEVFDQHAIVRNYVKWDHQLAWQDNPGLVMSRAIQVARTTPPGPVYVSFPKELAFQPVRDGGRFPSADQLGVPVPAALDDAAAREIAERLVRAQCPVVVTGRSGKDVSSVPALVALAELLGIGVVDGARRSYLCFPLNHPLAQGQALLPKADVVLALDAFVPWVPGRNNPPASAWVAAVGPDPIAARTPTFEFTADVRATADPARAIRAIHAWAEQLMDDGARARARDRSAALAESHAKRRANLAAEARQVATRTPMAPEWVSYQVNELLDDRSLLIDDTLAGPRTRDFIAMDRPGSLLSNPGSSGGWAVGAAFGAKLAAPDRDVIALTGDGFYMFGTPGPALLAARHYGAPFMVVVYTNRSYTTGTTRVGLAYGRDGYAARGGYEGGYFDPPIDFALEAHAAGAYGETVRDPGDVAPALRRGLARTREGQCAVISMWLPRLEAQD
jgi:acetolactate synthase-1/2/3 large subunit